MDLNIFANLLLALSLGGADIPAQAGFFESLVAENGQVSWGLGDVGTTDLGNSRVGPGNCTGSCTFDFSATPENLPFAFRGFTAYRAQFSFFGPATSAVADCSADACAGRSWTTTWGPVPITMTGILRWSDIRRPTEFFEFRIAGSGTARATNHYDLPIGPWNYSTARYDFDWVVVQDVVPEPEGLSLVCCAIGLLVVFVKRRGAKSSGAIPTTRTPSL